METQKYPLDFNSLDKGDTISRPQLEEIFGLKSTDEKFNFRVLGLCGKIERRLAKRGRLVTVAQVKGSVRVLLDKEALQHNNKWCSWYLERFANTYKKLTYIDAKNLSSEERLEYRRSVSVNGRLLQALNREKEFIRVGGEGQVKPSKLSKNALG